MVKVQQANKYFRVDKHTDNPYKITVYNTANVRYAEDNVFRIYLGFSVDVDSLSKLVYKPNVLWSVNIFALSNSVYLDEDRDECFITVYSYVDCLDIDLNVGTIECTEPFDIVLLEYAVNKKGCVNRDIAYILKHVNVGYDLSYFNGEIAELNDKHRYCYSWLNTAIMLIRRNYIALDDTGELLEKYTWLKTQIRGFKENNVFERIKELVTNGVEF